MTLSTTSYVCEYCGHGFPVNTAHVCNGEFRNNEEGK